MSQGGQAKGESGGKLKINHIYVYFISALFIKNSLFHPQQTHMNIHERERAATFLHKFIIFYCSTIFSFIHSFILFRITVRIYFIKRIFSEMANERHKGMANEHFYSNHFEQEKLDS
jgi:hypothetical protein